MRALNEARRFAQTARKNFLRHNPFQAAAALAYYALFSLAPLVIIIVAIAGLLITGADAQAALIERVRLIANEETARLVSTIIENTANQQSSLVSVVVAGTIMLVGATTAFTQLYSILNRVWNVPLGRRLSAWYFLKGRLLSFLILVVIGVLLAASLLFNTFLSNVGDLVNTHFGVELSYWEPLKLFTSYGSTTLLIAMLYKFLPACPVRWRDALIGAVAASVLFEAGKWIVGYYVTQMNPASAFGAAGSIIVFMFWVYGAALIVLIGTEVARTCSELYG